MVIEPGLTALEKYQLLTEDELLSAQDEYGEDAFSAGIGVSRFETLQNIVAAQYTTASGQPTVLTASDLRTACARPKSNCPPQLVRAFDPKSALLRSARLSAAVTATLFADTDLTLEGAYYGYDDDPTNAGYFTVGTAGRAGTGMAIAPLRYLIRPEATHRFGDLQLKVWVQGGEYVKQMGQWTTGGGLKAQYKFTQSFKMWAAASGQRDLDAGGQISKSGTVSLGVAYRF